MVAIATVVAMVMVRGAGGRSDRPFGAPEAIEELASLGLIRARGWANGPGMIWIPTPEGEAVYQALADGSSERASLQPVKTPVGERPSDHP